MANATDVQTTVISTRIRLARNFAAYPFPKKMDEAQAEDIVHLVGAGLKKFNRFTKYEVENITRQQAALLKEQYLISPALLKSKKGAAFISEDKTVSVMVNEEDHLRQQCILKGLDLYGAYECVSGIDRWLASIYDFAFTEKLGYLTACPSNLGTGMRASVMLFLPGLTWTGELKEEIRAWKAQGMTVRGAFGEGSVAEGYQYQVSNERTLGLSEKEILELVTEFTMVLCDREIVA
ncbi:MAG: ATP--guanido phosphotransferase, partial [Clostridia bacterium]|nr:ATP--guanido phosphotransferase [Clostridia bacterium]